MARSRYEFIKIELRLFRDHRFLMLKDFDKLLYIALVSLAKQTSNRIPKDYAFIVAYLNTESSPRVVRESIGRLTRVFEDLTQNSHYLWFKKWDDRYQYRGVEEEKEKEKDKEKDISFLKGTGKLKDYSHLKENEKKENN